jgi:hypothetical protein
MENERAIIDMFDDAIEKIEQTLEVTGGLCGIRVFAPIWARSSTREWIFVRIKRRYLKVVTRGGESTAVRDCTIIRRC